MRIFLFVILLLSGVSTAWANMTLGLNDVSVLVPLPKLEDDISLLLKPQDGLIPLNFLDRLEPLIIDDHAQDRRQSLKLVAFRIDPCFIESTGPSACRRQLRMVFQPVSYYNNHSLVFDAAVHAFYEFDEASWDLLLRDWQTTLTDKSLNTPLQIHPVLKSQGLRGPLWKTYRNILLRHCTPAHLIRLTQSTVDRFGMTWEFMGFDISPNGSFVKMEIPRIKMTKQVFFSNPGDIKEFSAEISPVPVADGFLADFFAGSSRQKPALQWQAVRRAMEFENPQRFNTANLDCVSCHMAQGLRLWGEAHFGGFNSDPEVARLRFFSPRNLELTARPFSISNRVRAFGYFFDEANISPRVINESALAAEALEKFLK